MKVMNLKSFQIKRSKSFALKIKELTVDRGSIVCLVGANGSGKTTLLEGVVGLIEADRGEVKIKNQKLVLDNIEAKKEIGYIPDDDSWVVAELMPREFFDLHISIYKDEQTKHRAEKNVDKLAKSLLFNGFDQPMGSLSHGNKKKVQFIAALLHDPSFLVVDELRNGLDPIAIKRAEQILKEKSKKGVAILAATHDLWWAERFADQIVMITEGRVLMQDTTKNIVEQSGSLENKFMELFGGQISAVN